MIKEADLAAHASHFGWTREQVKTHTQFLNELPEGTRTACMKDLTSQLSKHRTQTALMIESEKNEFYNGDEVVVRKSLGRKATKGFTEIIVMGAEIIADHGELLTVRKRFG